MKLLVVAVAACVLSVPVCAQTGFTSPTLMERIEGNNFADWLFTRPGQTHQVVEGDFRGSAHAKTITGILLRQDGTAKSAKNLGRTFSNVTIRMAPADYNRVSSTFSTNMTGAPTTVWSAALSLPTFTTGSVLQPGPWGGQKGEFRFSFTKNFIHQGKTDYLTEWKTSNGILANGRKWAAYGDSYYFDGEVASTAPVYVRATAFPPQRSTCQDSAITFSVGAFMFASATIQGGRVTLSSSSYYTAPSSTVIHAFGLPQFKGTDVGARCNNLYMFTFVPPLLISKPTAAVTGYALNSVNFKWETWFASFPLMVQAAWADSKSGQLSLTQGQYLLFPKMPPRAALPLRQTVLEFGPIAGKPNVVVTAADGQVSPIQFFTTK